MPFITSNQLGVIHRLVRNNAKNKMYKTTLIIIGLVMLLLGIVLWMEFGTEDFFGKLVS